MSAARLKHFGWGREGESLTAEEAETTPQRLRDTLLTRGNVARFFATRAWPTETALAGWACRWGIGAGRCG
jgi:hypothetical protein